MINVFPGGYAPFAPLNLDKVKYTSETVCQCISSAPLNRISWNFEVDKDMLCTCVFAQDILIWFFSVSTIRSMANVYYFVQLLWNRFSINASEAVQSDIFLTVNIPMLPNCDNY